MKEFKASEGRNVIRMYGCCMEEVDTLSRAFFIAVLQDNVIDDIEHGTTLYLQKAIQSPELPTVKGFYRISTRKMWVRVTEFNLYAPCIFNILFKNFVTSSNKSVYYNTLFKHDDKLEEKYESFLKIIYSGKDPKAYKYNNSCVATSRWNKGNLDLIITKPDCDIVPLPSADTISINKTMEFFLRFLHEFYFFASSEMTPRVVIRFENYKLSMNRRDDNSIRAIVRAEHKEQ